VLLLRDFFFGCKTVEIKPFAGEALWRALELSSTVYRLITHSFIPTSAKLREEAHTRENYDRNIASARNARTSFV